MEALISVQPQNEQRLTFRLLSYWQRMRGTRPFPSLSDIKIDEILEMWHWSFTINVADENHHFQYFGPELANIFGHNYTGEILQDAMSDPKVQQTIGFYEKAIRNREPTLDANSFNLEGKEVRYRSLIVPLSSDGKHIDYLMGTTNYKIF
ncbi:MAG: PAS domain-containing protein [Rickettsiales bacterium]